MNAPAMEAKVDRAILGGRTVLAHLQVAMAAGRWTSIVGPNGAGKSTLLRVMAGLLRAEGSVDLLGRPLAQWRRRERGRRLSWLGQGETTAGDLTVYDVAMLGRLPHQPWLAPPGEADHAAVERSLRSTQAWDWRERPLGQLSGGERQRVLLALHADDLFVMHRGQILHFGGCSEPATHRAVEQVFDHRISIHALAGQWVILPKP